MARNGSGTYSKVNTFVAGNTITASGHNQNWDDLVSEMTNSVAADGQTSMTGPLKLAAGSVGAPGMVFSSDTDTGIYRIGSNNLGIAVGGSKILDLVSTACNVIGTVQQNGFALVPIGVIWDYGGSSAPSGWLLCFGQAISRTTYADLFAALGTTYGTGNGSTTFNIPDLRGRTTAGKDDMGGSAASRLSGTSITSGGPTTLGGTGGADTKTLITANLPAYTPAGSISTTTTIAASASAGAFEAQYVTGNGSTINHDFSGSSTFTGTAQGGTSTAFSLAQPTLITNKIIFAGV